MALARAEHEIQLMLRRPAVQQAFDERGAQIVEAATGTPGTLRPLQREALVGREVAVVDEPTAPLSDAMIMGLMESGLPPLPRPSEWCSVVASLT